MSKKEPFVSIIVPVYNGEKVIAECIESLLQQTYPKNKYEIIIVDNNSKDKTADIIKKYPVKYLIEDKLQSPGAARNKGIKHAKGNILAFTDADCIAHCNWIRNAVYKFNKNKIDLLAGTVKPYNPQSDIEEYLSKRKYMTNNSVVSHDYEYDILPLPHIITASAFYKKYVIEKVGLFDEKLITGEDVDLSWRAQLAGFKIGYTKDAIIYHRHRRTLSKLLKQQYMYGFGRVLLFIKYKNISPHSRFSILTKILYWRYHRLSKLFLKFCSKYIYAKLTRKRQDYYYYDFLNFLCFLAYRIGHIHASIKNKIFYI